MRGRPPRITVPPALALKADDHAARVLASCNRFGRKHRNNLARDPVNDKHIGLMGYRAEAALHHYFGEEPNGSRWRLAVATSKEWQNRPDVTFRGVNHDAKGIDIRGRALMCFPEPPPEPDWRYVLVGVYDWPEAELLGWAYGSDVLTRPLEVRKTGRPAYFVDQTNPLLKPCCVLIGEPDPDDEQPVLFRPPPVREFVPGHSHQLIYDRDKRRWCCDCGYKLGDGREQFLAPCPLFGSQ